MILYPKKNRECIYIHGLQVKLGEEKDFIIHKILQIGTDNFYVFCDSLGDNYLIPAVYYEDYNFEIGQCIKGRIDKINCSGRIFIEPRHPKYIEGEVYDFDLLHGKFSNEKDSEAKAIYVVRDILGKECDVKSNVKMQLLPSSLKCRVDKIKKGQLYLTLIS